MRIFVLAAMLATFLAQASTLRAETVMVSIKPIHSLVAAVMKGAGKPGLIVQGNESPHTYQLKPSTATRLAEAKLVFWVGPKLETFLTKPLATVASKARAVALIEARGLVTRKFREHQIFSAGDDGDHDNDHEKGHDKHADHDHHHDGTDVHLWLDPVNAMAMTDAIAKALADLEPKNAALFHNNAEALKVRLNALNKELAAQLKPVKDARFVVYHDAYQYFEARYGLKAVGAVTVSPDIRPGARHLLELKEKMAAKDVTCAFLEPGVDKRLFKILGATGLRVAELDPAGIDLKPGTELYPALLYNMAANFKKCVKP